MTLYMFTALLIAIPGFFYGEVRKRTFWGTPYKSYYVSADLKYSNRYESRHIFIIMALLIFMSANRGAFSADDYNYREIFSECGSFKKIQDFLLYTRVEYGYSLLNFFVSKITRDYYWMQWINTLLTLIPVWYISKYSPYPWLSVFIYYIFGTYFQSFNVVRSMISASIVFMGVEGLYNGNKKRYFLCTLIATLFHTTAIGMFLMYFIFEYNKDKIKWWQIGLIYILLSSFIILIAGQYQYIVNDSMSIIDEVRGYGSGIYVLPSILTLLLTMLYFINAKTAGFQDEFSKTTINISLLGSLLWCLCYILSNQVTLMIRITGFFLPFIMIGLPYSISKINDKNVRLLIKLFICTMGIAYFAQSIGSQEWVSI